MTDEAEPTNLQRVGVVGCGLMGSGIAEVCARHGLDVMVMEVRDDRPRSGAARVFGSLDNAVRRGKLSEEERDAAVGAAGVHDRPRRAR